MKFDQLTKKKKNFFDQTPKLTENFDQLKMSSEIRSSDHSPKLPNHIKKCQMGYDKKIKDYLKTFTN